MIATGSTFYMMKLEQIKDIVNKCEEPIEKSEDWSIYEYSGSNIDDAYEFGVIDGKAYLVSEIKKLLNEPIFINEVVQ